MATERFQGDHDTVNAPELAEAQIICVIGGPCVGKGTQCKQLAVHFNAVHVSVGDLLRDKAKTILAQRKVDVIAHMSAGGLVPTKIVQEMLEDHLIQNLKEGKTCFFVDGFPRSMEQALLFKDRGCTIQGVLCFESPEETMLNRMKGRAKTEDRVDDNVETFKERYQGFKQESGQIFGYFEQQGKFHRIDCGRPLDDESLYDEICCLATTMFRSTTTQAEEMTS